MFSSYHHLKYLNFIKEFTADCFFWLFFLLLFIIMRNFCLILIYIELKINFMRFVIKNKKLQQIIFLIILHNKNLLKSKIEVKSYLQMDKLGEL